MSLLPITESILAEIEEASGRPVLVREDPSLPTLATIHTARGDAPAHFVAYRPSSFPADYLIVYQLGPLRRMLAAPPDKRFDMVQAPDADRAGQRILGESSDAQIRQLFPSLLRNLMVQLRTYAIGLRVDQWIYTDLPDLRGGQRHYLELQLRQNEQTLHPDIAAQFPTKLVQANRAMNGALALFTSRLFGDSRVFLPYEALGIGTLARSLVDALRTVPDDPARDPELIDVWAAKLGLTGLHSFQPYSLNS